MKKNGFTIVELLSIIVILAVILSIAIPKVMSAVDESRKKAFVYSAESIVKEAKSSSILNEITNKTYVIENGSFVGEKFDVNGELPDEGTIYINGEGKIAFTLQKGKYCIVKEFNTSIQISENPTCELFFSTLTLLGDDPYYVMQGVPYVDPGFTAIDEFGLSAPSKVEITGTVDTSKVGIYNLKYELKSDAGEILDSKTRMVLVVDSVPPVVTIATIVSNNIYNNKYAKNGELLTLSLEFSKEVTTPTVTIGGRSATVTGVGDTRVATYLIPAGEATLANGALNINVSNFIDIYDNLGTTRNSVTSGGLVTFDNVAPTITSSVIVSNNTNNKLAKNGEILTMTTNFSEVVRALTSTLSTRATTVSGLNTSTTNSSYTIPAGEATLTQGNIVGAVSSYMDRAGNPGLSMNIALVGATVVYDRTAPTCAVSGGNAAWTNVNRTVTGTCSDAGGSLCVGNISYGYGVDINTTTAGAAGNNLGGTVRDNAGNTVACAANQTVRVDKTAPAIAESYSGGMLFPDPNFASGTNSFGVYNNAGGGTVTHSRVALTNPYGSYVMRITTSGVASPGLGGYVQSVNSRANATYIHRIIAKVPVGSRLQYASNAVGTGSVFEWLTPTAGTGDWKEYIYTLKTGSTGTFNNFGYVYLIGGAVPISWDVAYSTIIDTGKQEITSNIAFKATDSGSGFTHYGINQSSTTQPTYTAVTNSSSLGVMKDKITTNGTYYIWVKDAVGNFSNKAITVNTIIEPTDASCFTYTKTSTEVTITDYNETCTKDVIIPNKIEGLPVTSIGSYAFAYNQLTSVVIPSSVTSIGSSAFYNNQLTSVDIPSSVTSIASYAFGYNKLTSVVIPSSVTSIDYYAFAWNQLTSVDIPASVTSIGDYTFRSNQLTSITIRNGVTSIGSAAFQDNQLTSVVIPSSVTSIGSAAFYNNQLTSVDIPSSVTSIGVSAFYNNQLTSVVIPSSVTSIGSSAFSQNQLTSVVIPSSVTSIGDYAFSDNQLTSVVIPSSVTSIGSYAFRSNQLTSVVIPSSVTSIGSCAFQSNQLTSVDIPSSVTSIESSAFNNNQLPDNQAFIYKRNSDGSEDKTTIVSYGGAKRDNVSIPNSVTSIGSYAFQSNQLTSVDIPSSVTSIGEWAFYGNQLKSVDIPSSVTSIASYAFGYNKLTSVVIPSSVTSIGEWAFYGNQLKSVDIPSSVTSIASYAFGYNKLTSVVIPSSVTSIGNGAFSDNQLTSVVIPSSVTLSNSSISSSFYTSYVTNNNKSGGTYTAPSQYGVWTKQP